MGEVKPLMNKEAVKKMQEMFGDGNSLMFASNLGTTPIDISPMSTQKVEDNGEVWFFSAKDSDRNSYIQKDSRVQLIYSDNSKSDYLSIYGEAEIVHDHAKAKELWTPMVKAWFQEGPEDPNLSLIKFTPSEGFYWDTKNGKMVAFAKILTSIVTGKTMDDSVEGTLKP
jgi:general stress protein 26